MNLLTPSVDLQRATLLAKHCSVESPERAHLQADGQAHNARDPVFLGFQPRFANPFGPGLVADVNASPHAQ